MRLMRIRSFRQLFNFYWHPRRDFVRQIAYIAGVVPRELSLYEQAFQHSSLVRNPAESSRESNERLEFLGDAMLGAIMADILYRKYPTRSEGFLTEMRSRMVKRKSLNQFSVQMGLDTLLQHDGRNRNPQGSMYGNTLEAFIGALYLDHGWHGTYRFVQERIVDSLVSLDTVEATDDNHKSRLMEYVQKYKLEPIRFEVLKEKNSGGRREFTIGVKIGDILLGKGTDTKKKQAEQTAAAAALRQLPSDGPPTDLLARLADRAKQRLILDPSPNATPDPDEMGLRGAPAIMPEDRRFAPEATNPNRPPSELEAPAVDTALLPHERTANALADGPGHQAQAG
jgi:ribonuclease-3